MTETDWRKYQENPDYALGIEKANYMLTVQELNALVTQHIEKNYEHPQTFYLKIANGQRRVEAAFKKVSQAYDKTLDVRKTEFFAAGVGFTQ
jgi:hypothetical protein